MQTDPGLGSVFFNFSPKDYRDFTDFYRQSRTYLSASSFQLPARNKKQIPNWKPAFIISNKS